MEAWEEGWEAMTERLAEMANLRAAFRARIEKPSPQWVTECITAITVSLFDRNVSPDKIDLMVTLTLAMWQAGYEAAPKLEFVLPEGAGGCFRS